MNIAVFIVSSRLFLVFAALLILLIYLRIKFFKLKIDFLSGKNENRPVPKLFEINGIIHFHTVYSDGSGRIEDLIETAKKT